MRVLLRFFVFFVLSGVVLMPLFLLSFDETLFSAPYALLYYFGSDADWSENLGDFVLVGPQVFLGACVFGFLGAAVGVRGVWQNFVFAVAAGGLCVCVFLFVYGPVETYAPVKNSLNVSKAKLLFLQAPDFFLAYGSWDDSEKAFVYPLESGVALSGTFGYAFEGDLWRYSPENSWMPAAKKMSMPLSSFFRSPSYVVLEEYLWGSVLQRMLQSQFFENVHQYFLYVLYLGENLGAYSWDSVLLFLDACVKLMLCFFAASALVALFSRNLVLWNLVCVVVLGGMLLLWESLLSYFGGAGVVLEGLKVFFYECQWEYSVIAGGLIAFLGICLFWKERFLALEPR